MAAVVTGIVEPLQYLEIVRVTIEAHDVVNILGNPAPAASLRPWAPHDDVVAGEVVVVVVEVHHHQVDKLLTVHPLLIFGHRVAMLIVECLELVQIVQAALLQVAPVLDEVNVFQAVIVCIDIVLVSPFADIEHAMIDAVDIDDSGLPRLPVKVGMGGHRTLGNGVSHVEVVEVVAGITEHERLEVRQPRLLVGEELVVEALGAKPLMGIEGHRLLLRSPGSSACHTGFAKLIDDTGLFFAKEELDIDGAPPVSTIISVVIGKNAQLTVVQILVVGDNRHDGQGHVTWEVDVRLRLCHWRQPAVVEQAGLHDLRSRECQRGLILHAASRRLRTVEGIADDGTLRTFRWQRQR